MGTLNQVSNVRDFLVRQYNIRPPNDWLESCIEFITAECPPGNLNNQVLEQWLMGDLREIGGGTLPLVQDKENQITINGTHSVQVNSCIDIGQPAYLQLQKMAGTELDEVEEPAAEWKSKIAPKSRRMLLMEITDGTTAMQAMEYRSISADIFDFKPGVKVKLSGPIICRRVTPEASWTGMEMMLTGQNISIIGGSTESLAASNTLEELLKGRLHAPVDIAIRRGTALSTQNNQRQRQNGAVQLPAAPARNAAPPISLPRSNPLASIPVQQKIEIPEDDVDELAMLMAAEEVENELLEQERQASLKVELRQPQASNTESSRSLIACLENGIENFVIDGYVCGTKGKLSTGSKGWKTRVEVYDTLSKHRADCVIKNELLTKVIGYRADEIKSATGNSTEECLNRLRTWLETCGGRLTMAFDGELELVSVEKDAKVYQT